MPLLRQVPGYPGFLLVFGSWFNDVSAVLDGTDYAEGVRNDEQLARKLDITGVPCFVFPQPNEGVSDAQPPEVLGDAINMAAQR